MAPVSLLKETHLSDLIFKQFGSNVRCYGERRGAGSPFSSGDRVPRTAVVPSRGNFFLYLGSDTHATTPVGG